MLASLKLLDLMKTQLIKVLDDPKYSLVLTTQLVALILLG